MPKFRRGAAAIKEANEPPRQSKFRSFAPTITWGKDAMEKYVLILTPIDEVVSVSLHSWIPVGKVKRNGSESYRYEDFISRKDPAIGEGYDPIEDDFDRNPQTRIFGVGVELEPTFETVRGRKKPTGFEVATRSYTRKSDDGEIEVEVAKIGLIVQSAKLMWTPLQSMDASQGPLEYLPLQINREGMDQSTDYTVIPFADVPVDLSSVIDTLDGLSYLTAQQEEIIAEIDSLDEDAEDFDLKAAQVVARTLLDTRLEELADKDRYDELTSNIESLPQPFTKGTPVFKSGGSPSARKEDPVEDDDEEEKPKRKPRPARKSQRDKAKEKKAEEPEEADEPDEDPEEEPEPEPEEKPKPKSKAKSGKRSRFDELKERLEAEQSE